MNGQELYERYVAKMEFVSTDPFDTWDDLNIAVQQAWESLADDISIMFYKE